MFSPNNQNLLDVLVRDVHRIDEIIPGLRDIFLQLRPGNLDRLLLVWG